MILGQVQMMPIMQVAGAPQQLQQMGPPMMPPQQPPQPPHMPQAKLPDYMSEEKLQEKGRLNGSFHFLSF